MVCFFVMIFARGDDVNIAEFIKKNKELSELPFLIVFRTISVLNEMGVLVNKSGDSDVEKA